MARTQKKHKQSKGERVRIRLISKLFDLYIKKPNLYNPLIFSMAKWYVFERQNK